MPGGPADGQPERSPVNPELDEVLGRATNAELLARLDLVLLELEKRLLRYAQDGPEILAMADEGLLLAARAGARLRQAQSSAAHAAGHLQLVGLGRWSPRTTNPSWHDAPRVTTDEE